MATALVVPVVVVVAEEEFLLRVVTVEVLAEEGFVVHEAQHSGHALAILEAAAEIIDVLLVDVLRPGDMDGMGLARHVSAHWPHIGLLLTSTNSPASAADLPGGARFLPKPYEPDALSKHVLELAHID